MGLSAFGPAGALHGIGQMGRRVDHGKFAGDQPTDRRIDIPFRDPNRVEAVWDLHRWDGDAHVRPGQRRAAIQYVRWDQVLLWWGW